jgi:hypothetical protein
MIAYLVDKNLSLITIRALTPLMLEDIRGAKRLIATMTRFEGDDVKYEDVAVNLLGQVHPCRPDHLVLEIPSRWEFELVNLFPDWNCRSYNEFQEAVQLFEMWRSERAGAAHNVSTGATADGNR